MVEAKYQPAATSDPTELPPSYDAAAVQHGSDLPAAGKTAKIPLPRGPFPLEIPALMQLRGKRVILASASPRRKQLLGQVRLPYPTLPSNTPRCAGDHPY